MKQACLLSAGSRAWAVKNDAEPGSRGDLREKPRRPLTSTLAGLGDLQMDAHEAVTNFRDFLATGHAAWIRAEKVALEADRGFLDEAFGDWAQANWELLVERPLLGSAQYLEIYGSGSDYEAQLYSRVFFHDAKFTHKIICVPARDQPTKDLLSRDPVDFTKWEFDRLVAHVGDWYDDVPPFDHVLLHRAPADTALVPIAAVQFLLLEIA